MNKFRQLFVTAFVVFGISSGAIAQAQSPVQNQYYAALGIGYDSMPNRGLDLNSTSRGTVFTFPLTSVWKDGYGVLATGGYKWDFGLRTEVEFSSRIAKVTAFNTNPWYGTQWDYSLMINALYDFDLGIGVKPYIGGGVGPSHIQWTDNFRAVGPTIYDGESTKVGWQGIVGIEYPVTQRIELALDGRIKGANGYSFPGSATGSSVTNFNYLTRSIFLSIRYNFGT